MLKNNYDLEIKNIQNIYQLVFNVNYSAKLPIKKILKISKNIKIFN